MTKYVLLMALSSISLCCFAQFEQTELMGILVTKKGEPISHVSVLIVIPEKASDPKAIGTVTDSCGRFNLTIPDSLIVGHKLVFNTHNYLHEYPLIDLQLYDYTNFVFKDMLNRYGSMEGCDFDDEIKNYKVIKMR